MPEGTAPQLLDIAQLAAANLPATQNTRGESA
jgi:hypothetical protein